MLTEKAPPKKIYISNIYCSFRRLGNSIKKAPPPKGIDFSVAGHLNMNYFTAKVGVLFGLEKTET